MIRPPQSTALPTSRKPRMLLNSIPVALSMLSDIIGQDFIFRWSPRALFKNQSTLVSSFITGQQTLPLLGNSFVLTVISRSSHLTWLSTTTDNIIKFTYLENQITIYFIFGSTKVENFYHDKEVVAPNVRSLWLREPIAHSNSLK